MTSTLAGLTAREVIALLDLKPHPEGGHYRETFRDEAGPEGRGHSTAIYYLLDTGETSEWHRVDAAEIWHHYAGAPLVISVSPNGHDASAHHLGTDLKAGQRPQFVVPARWWQSATSLGAWTLVGCTVAPGFAFSGFEMAPPGWRRRREDQEAPDGRNQPRGFGAGARMRTPHRQCLAGGLDAGDGRLGDPLRQRLFGRANSASPLKAGAELDDAMLGLIEELYRADGLPPCIRLTPLTGEATQAAVLSRGYRLKDASLGMICDLGGVAPEFEPELQIEAGPSADWMAGVAARQSGEKAHRGNLAAIVEKIRMPAAFATLLIAGEPVAYGLGVAERGMAEIGSIIVDPAQRGHGYGKRIVAGLMSWAKVQDCAQAYLQVDQTNTVAIRLYGGLGYRRLYAYETRILD